ncbi:MAG: tyrosine-type recombinase/integrase [Alphaproteobacteria bacterium]|nr:tyrosine-type recombinase/integrase [Alphaproteobacteria bacterium]
MVGALCEQGQDIARLLTLADLVDLDRVRAIVAFFQERSALSGATMAGKIADGGILHVLRMIARHVRPDDDALHTRLKKAHGRTSSGPRSMGRRPAAALRQFDDPAAFDSLLRLPPAITTRLDAKDRLTRRDALDYQAAVALELLIMRPIRLKNLAGLRIGEHVRRDAGGVRIVIPADQVKNGVAIEHVLPRESVAMLERYLDKVLPVLSSDPSGHLFPGAIAGRPKAQENLGKQTSRLVRRHTGLAVSPHLMRHVGAKLYMTAVPEGLETMRQVLSHKSADTTARSYVGLQNAAAIARYDALVLARRGQLEPAATR